MLIVLLAPNFLLARTCAPVLPQLLNLMFDMFYLLYLFACFVLYCCHFVCFVCLFEVYDVLVCCERVEFGDCLRLRLLLLVMLQVDGVFFLLLVGVRAAAAVSKAWVLFRVTATLLQDEIESTLWDAVASS